MGKKHKGKGKWSKNGGKGKDGDWKDQKCRQTFSDLGIDKGDAVGVTRKNANWLGFGVIQRSSIPHTDQTVVTTAEQDLRSVVRKRHGIHVVFVSLIVVEMKKMRTNERGKEEIGYWIWLKEFVQGKGKRERNA